MHLLNIFHNNLAQSIAVQTGRSPHDITKNIIISLHLPCIMLVSLLTQECISVFMYIVMIPGNML